MLADEAIETLLEFTLSSRDLPMSETKSVATMSLSGSKYEYVRIRPRNKDRDRDKDSDKRSSIVGGIAVKRPHRESTTTKSIVPSDSVSQACTETRSNITDIHLPESSTTLPLQRNSSAISLTSRNSLSTIQTPVTLQPYLESEAGDAATTVATEKLATEAEAKKEWIGPIEDGNKSADKSEDSATPKPTQRVPSDAKGKEPASTSSTSPDVGCYENPFLPMRMTDSFPPNVASIPPPISPHLSMSLPPYHQPLPRPPTSPAQTWHDAPSQRSSSVVSTSRSITSAPSYTTTYVGQQQSKMYPSQADPMMLLQRVSNAMPDIYMLMQHFHENLATLGMRESQIHQLETQKEADAERQEEHIEKLTNEIEAVLAKHAYKVEELETKIGKLEEVKSQLEISLLRETQSKADAKLASDKLRAEQKQMAMRYLEEKEEMAANHSMEKHRLMSEHAGAQQALSDHTQAQTRIAEANMSARVSELNRLHEDERQHREDCNAREKREIEEGHAKTHRDLQDTLAAKIKIIDEERRNCSRMKQIWEKEHDEMSLRSDEERTRHRKELEDYNHDLTEKHQKERGEMVKSLEVLHACHQAKNQATIREQERALESQSRQAAEAQNTILRLQRDAETQKRHSSDVQDAFRKLQSENADMRTALETAQSRQQQLELRDYNCKPHDDNDVQNRSKTPSRQRSDPQENIKLRRDLENERGRNEDARDTINKLRRDMEVLKAQWKQSQAPTSSSPVLSSPKASGDEKKWPLQKTTSSESSASQKHVAESSVSAAKSKSNITWQT